jgi:hypothetical protein
MASLDASTDIAQWQRTLYRELESHLADLRSDPAVCGFALELPSDFTNDGVISRVAKYKKGLLGMKIPPLDSWEYVPNAKTFGASCDELEEIYRKYSEPLEDETFYRNFGNRLYAASLDAMKQCVSSSAFGDIKVRVLLLSDDEHPIIDQAVEALNEVSMQKTARKIVH